MIKKRVALLSSIFIVLFTISLVFAINEIGVEKAYSCLESQLGDNCGNTQSTEQTAFSLLAISYNSSLQSDCLTSLKEKKQGNCFGATKTANCDLKSTAQAILALDNIGEDTENYTDWILEKKKSTTGLDWFLEIDANEATTCTVNGDTFTIDENKQISGTSSCLTPAENNYFLKISDGCLNKNFTISCDKDFITTLLYKKTGDSTYHVSSKTHSAPANGITEEKVDFYCFTTSNVCDYEGSLWATLALAKTWKETRDYLPYLFAMYDLPENKDVFPSAFLYMLTDDDNYYVDIIEKQNQGKYWQEGNNKYYDTALALLSLQGLSLQETDNAKNYLLEIQDNSGCWHSNNIRDTSFILYSAWPEPPVSIGIIGGEEEEEAESRSDCRDFGHYCTAPSECSLEDTLDNFYCPGLSDVCCLTMPEEQTCEEKGGIVCEQGQECTGSEVTASDTNYCCLASCIAISTTTECEEYGFVCKSVCSSDEEEKTGYSCNYGDVCCAKKQIEKKANWLLIILLIILIILVILAIIFRNQLKIWWFRFKGGVKFGRPPSGGGRPPITPTFTRPRQIIPRQHIPVKRPPVRVPPRKPEKDTLFEETMKKLREMAK